MKTSSDGFQQCYNTVRVFFRRPIRLALRDLRNLPVSLFLLGILSYGAALAWYMLEQYDLGSFLRSSSDDAFYYFEIARNLADGEFSTFDGGITRTNGYHPLWMLLITPAYWIFDPKTALFVIRAFEILLIAGGVALIAAAARLARLPWFVLLAVPSALYLQDGMLQGMESAAALAMLGLLVLALVLVVRNPVRWTWLLAAVAFALPWVRLELAAVSVAATAALCAIEWSRAMPFDTPPVNILHAVRSRAAMPLLCAGASVLLYFAYNGLVFGGLVPVSGAVKQLWAQRYWEQEGGYSIAEQVPAMLRTWPFDDELLAALEVCLYLSLAWWLVRGTRNADGQFALAFLAGVFSLAAGHLAKFVQTVLTVHPAAPAFAWYFVPAYLMTALLVPVRTCVAVLLVRRLVEPRLPRAAGVLRLGIVMSATVFLLTTTDFKGPFREIDAAGRTSYRSWQLASYTGTQVMNRVLPEGSVIGSSDAGVVGYFSRFPVVNLDGLVNSYEHLRALKQSGERLRSFRQKLGITHFANVRPVDESREGVLFEGLELQRRKMEFKMWPAHPAGGPASGLHAAAWFWGRIAPHFDYRWDDVGVLVDEGLAQIFVRQCKPERLRERKFVFTWLSGDSGRPAFAWYAWEDPRRNRLGLCVTVFEPPGDAVDIEALPARDYAARLVSDSRLLIRSDYDVYRDGNRLVYVRDPCPREDVERRFFVYVWPADPADLSVQRQRHGFDNLDFDFRRSGTRTGERCIAVRELPSYAIGRITTGQFVPGSGRLWEDSIDFRSPADRAPFP